MRGGLPTSAMPHRRDRFMSTYEHGVYSPFVLYAVAAYERAFSLMEQTLGRSMSRPCPPPPYFCLAF